MTSHCPPILKSDHEVSGTPPSHHSNPHPIHIIFETSTLNDTSSSKDDNSLQKQCSPPTLVPTMSLSLLQSTPLLQGLGLNHGNDASSPKISRKQQAQRTVRPTSSLGNLIHFARNPIEIASEAVEDWYDGSTKKERARRQAVADRKQLLYLKMRTVSPLLRYRYHCL